MRRRSLQITARGLTHATIAICFSYRPRIIADIRAAWVAASDSSKTEPLGIVETVDKEEESAGWADRKQGRLRKSKHGWRLGIRAPVFLALMVRILGPENRWGLSATQNSSAVSTCLACAVEFPALSPAHSAPISAAMQCCLELITIDYPSVPKPSLELLPDAWPVSLL